MYALGFPLRARKRSMLYLTSSAVSSRPFTGGFGCQRTPRRSLKTYVISSGWLHDSARSPSIANVPGTTAGPTLCLTSRLWVNEYTTCVLYDTCRYGSKWGGSQSRRVIVPPRFG